jgi:hypothetical protein
MENIYEPSNKPFRVLLIDGDKEVLVEHESYKREDGTTFEAILARRPFEPL